MHRLSHEDISQTEVYEEDPHLTLEIQQDEEDPQISIRSSNPQISNSRQSSHLPHWLFFAISKSLGIKKQERERPILSCILYILTFASALGYIFTNWCYSTFDIISDYTKTTIIDGTISIIFIILWSALGIYANNLSYRLFSHPHFTNLIKLHSKTILKMNAAILLFLLMTSFTIISCIKGFHSSHEDLCKRVSLGAAVCWMRYAFRVIFSLFSLAWNYLVAFALISTCRSHVVDIRKLMQILEKDSQSCEARYLGLSASRYYTVPLEEYTWMEDDYLEELREVNREETGSHIYPISGADSNYGTESCDIPLSSSKSSDSQIASRVTRSPIRPLLSNEDILFRYWKIQEQLRRSSVAFQRWMMSMISLVVIWLTMNLVLWLNYDPSLIDLANFILPLLLLPLLSSAYAEVNQEGNRLLKFICPVENRLQLLLVLQRSELQMTVYGFSVSYSSIGTAAFGVLLALASKVLLQKMV